MSGLTQVALAGGLAVVLASAATPASALLVVDFEEFAPGQGDIHYLDHGASITGGIVATGGEFTPHSGTNVYVGTSIEMVQHTFSGDRLSAYVSPGADTVFISFFGYDPETGEFSKIGERQTIGPDGNQHIVFRGPFNPPPWVSSMSFVSASPFAVDDLTFVRRVLPEPGTWAMMILGFGAAGAALRRRSGPGARLRSRP